MLLRVEMTRGAFASGTRMCAHEDFLSPKKVLIFRSGAGGLWEGRVGGAPWTVSCG